MEVKIITKSFHIMPVFSISKHINPLSDAAKKTFDSNWECYYSVNIGWLFWGNFKIDFYD